LLLAPLTSLGLTPEHVVRLEGWAASRNAYPSNGT
jgi:hypothetical protein